MGYRNLRECVDDLAANGGLVRITCEVDPDLEVGAIQRRVYQAGGPALLFTRVKGCSFPMLGNLFGTLERTRFLFRDTLDDIRRLVQLKINPAHCSEGSSRLSVVQFRLRYELFPRAVSNGPVLSCTTTIDQLPQLRSWPSDGGPFITLPQVYSESVTRPGWRHSNLGMYRVQLGGNRYRQNEEIGLHYQLHRGIGVHHAEAIERGVPFRVNIFVGGPPALTVAAVMPLPEGMPELSFAGLLAWQKDRTGFAGRGSCRSPQKPISALPARSTRPGDSPRDRSATTSATTALLMISRC